MTGLDTILRVMISGAFTAACRDLMPEFERASGGKVVAAYGASMGGGPTSIPNRVRGGEPVDVVVLANTALEDLIKSGYVMANSPVNLVRSRIGAVVQAGSPKPNISSAEALKGTLLRARSIAYSDSASGVYISKELFQRLGIAHQVLPKSKRINGMVGPAVARGEAEIGFQQISELLPVDGIDYLGALPDEVQKVTVFSAGIAVGSKEPEAARSLIRFLASPSAATVIARTGLEPIADR